MVDYSAPPPNASVDPGYTPNAPPQLGAIPTPPTVVVPSAPVRAPQPAPGGIRATPQQFVAGSLAGLQNKENLAQQGGQIESAGQQQIADIMMADAGQKAQNASDYQQTLQTANQRQQRFADQTQQAWQDHAKAATQSGKDPTEEFWKDRGTPRRILSGLAAFASGLGSGLSGKGGNPYLDFLNGEIDKNFKAHQAHIQDLYQSEVESGKLQDTDLNRARFNDQAKLNYYQLSGQAIIPKLQAVAATTQSQAVKLTAQNAIADFQQQELGMRQNLTAAEAQRAYTSLQQQRAGEKEVRAAYQAALDKHVAAGESAEDARTNATKDVEMYNNSSSPGHRTGFGQVASGIGATFDAKTGKYSYPEISPGGSAGEDIVPTKDPQTGRLLKPEERQQLRSQVVSTPTGKAMANSKEDADDYRIMSGATNDLEDNLKKIKGIEVKLQDPTTSPDEAKRLTGEYETLTKDMVVRYNTAATGTKRATGQGEAHTLGEASIPEPPSDVGAATGIYSRNRILKNEGKIKALEGIIENNRKALPSYLQTTPKAAETKTAPVTVKVADLPPVK